MVVVVVGLSRLDFHRFFQRLPTPKSRQSSRVFLIGGRCRRKEAQVYCPRAIWWPTANHLSLSLSLLSHVLWINRATTDSNIKRCLVFKLANKVCGNYLLLSSFCFLFFPIHLIPPLRYLLSSSPFPRLSHTIGDRRRLLLSPARSFEILIRS